MIRPRWLLGDVELEPARRGGVRAQVAEPGEEQEHEAELEPGREREGHDPGAHEGQRCHEAAHGSGRAAGHDEGRGDRAGSECADHQARHGVGVAELLGEGRCEGVHRIRREPHGGDDEEVGEEPRLPRHEPEAVPESGFPVCGARLLPGPKLEQREREDQVARRVDRERFGDAEGCDREPGERRPGGTRDVERHRVERHRGGKVARRDERPDQRHLGRRRERRHDADRKYEADHERSGREVEGGHEREHPGQERRQRLRDQEELPPVVPVGRAPGPGREHQHRDEVRERQDPEQELGACQSVDENRSGEVLEPAAARRQRVPDEVRRELTRPQELNDRPRPDCRRRPFAVLRAGYSDAPFARDQARARRSSPST